MKHLIPIAAAAFTLLGCASHPDKISTASVSVLQYKNYSCDQLASEEQRITNRASELYSSLKKTADTDAIQMGVGLVLFWPTLFFLEGGDDERAREYSKLKGEKEAIETASIQKNC
ncbi:metal ABC transporter ATP-binding protein [bacterium]|nr:metal ABC transporter ATP-binding protein [bacterium]